MPQQQSQTPAAEQKGASMQQVQSATGAQANVQFMSQQSEREWRGSNLMGESVVGTNNETIGDIEDVLIDRNGTVRAVVVGVGGFLGMGEKSVAIPFNALTINRNSDGDDVERITVSLSKDQLKQAPEFKYLPDADRTASRATAGAATGSTAPSEPKAGSGSTSGAKQ
jgi:hypothetical protein